MDNVSADLALQAVFGRTDFIGGIDNEALDFSQLEAFINSEGSNGNSYFTESLSTTTPSAQNTAGKLLNVIVENKRPAGHALPESPPDSGSEHPYSPQESCDPPINSQEIIYTTLGPGTHLYKSDSTILTPLITENLILSSSIMVPGSTRHQNVISNSDGNLVNPEGTRLLVQNQDGSEPRLMQGRLLENGSLTQLEGRSILTTDGLTDARHMIITQDSNDSSNRILIQPGPPSQGSTSYSTDRPILVENTEVRRPDLETNITSYNPNIDISRGTIESQIIDNNIDVIYTNLQNTPKKRKLSQDVPLVKSEPELCQSGQLSPPSQSNGNVEDDYAASENGACLSDSQYQCIRFQPFQQTNWHVLCDQNLSELPTPHYRVDADKGFNFSNADDAFVCQKKNHFQITCHVQLVGDAQFVKTPEGFQKITNFHLHFYGVKYDCPTQTIRIEQSQSDRSKKPFHPVLVELVSTQVTKVTVGRLHFSETTSNNMRKKGKPNPEQRYFQLVVGLHAHTSHGNYAVASHASQRIIVRASNPGQFESDVELCWQKGQTQDSIFHSGKVGINTDRPDETLVIHGNLKITGHIIQPSDLRAKKNIVECDTAEQLRNVQKLRVVRYEYAPGFASHLNMNTDLSDTGVIAQEVAEVIPEAVCPSGDVTLDNGNTINNFLVVNKERIFMENIGAVKELCKVTDNLETRIGQLERINRKLTKLKRDDSMKSTSTVNSSKPKCRKHNSCQKEPELCSNKVIQIVIVILVLIMAFCLAAITTLYLMEAGRHNQLTPPYNYGNPNRYNNKIPLKSSKSRNWPNMQDIPQNYKEKDNLINNRAPIENIISTSKQPMVIGKPSFCQGLESDIENSNLCQVYCCLPGINSVVTNEEVDLNNFEKSHKLNTTKDPSTIITIDQNTISKPFPSNTIDKQRQRRDTDDWTDQENVYDTLDTTEQFFTVIVQGRNFNMTLTNDYCQYCSSNSFNITYIVPISKYMADDYIILTFKPNPNANVKDLENCNNGFKQECPFWDGDKTSTKFIKENEKIKHQQIESKITGTSFEVNMIGFQSKTMTYRASLIQNQNVCRLGANKVGKEYVEYNLNFYRDCND